MKKNIFLAALALILTLGLAFVIEQTSTLPDDSSDTVMQIDFEDVGPDLRNPISKIDW